jgi:3-oxoacyl-[acyl-carrier-protein] synthase-3
MVHPGLCDEPARIRFTDTHQRMTTEAVDFLATSARRVVEAAGTTLEAIDWFVPHQPNGSMLARAVEVLGIGERCVPIVHETGAIGSASMGVSLDRLRRSGRLKAGQTVLFVGVGAGVGYGALLYREAA